MTVNNNLSFADKSCYLVDTKLPPILLDELTKQIKELTYTKSKTGSPGLEVENNIRTSTQSWICWDTWVAGIMHNMFISANNDYFNYDLDHFDSGIQATKYEVGQKYDWHVDTGEGDSKDKLPRKLSMTFVLNDDFEGGELQTFHPPHHRIITHKIKAGSVCIFPAWISHRVKPVTSGTRYSLVAWMNGPDFK